MDISGSTEGKVLDEEKDVISTLCSGLSRDAITQASVVPWSHFVQNVIRPDELDGLFSDGGGTDPSELNNDDDAKIALSKCSAWFLLTDGEIGTREVHRFSNGICEAGLHGTPCVVILFGYKTSRPIRCNISVGLSVFSNAADCLFLFHDIDTMQAYIIQAKGAFKALLPLGCQTLTLDPSTLWKDLPLFEYRQLFNLPLPARHQLQSNDLLLQDQHQINLQDLYGDRLHAEEASAILNNDDDLHAVMLAAQVRGDDEAIRNWISKQKTVEEDILPCDIPDVNQEAARSMRRLIAAKTSSTYSSLKEKHLAICKSQVGLRVAHRANWRKFISAVAPKLTQRLERNLIVDGALARLDSNLVDLRSEINSPALLSPVSTNLLGPSNIGDDPEPKGQRTSFADRKSAFINHGLIEDPYVKGYGSRWRGSSDSRVDAKCPLCGEEEILLILLLKKPPENLSTPGFPGPGEGKHLAYPLAMGTYPETDLLSSCMCCDSCADTLLKDGICLEGEQMIAAIPLVEEAFNGNYFQTTIDSVDTALQQRFPRSNVELVFLSIIHATFANLDGDDMELQSRALKQVSCWIATTATLPADLSMSITSTPRAGHSSLSSRQAGLLPLTEVLRENIRHVHRPQAPILQYPLNGFIVMVMVVTWMGKTMLQEIGTPNLRLAVWHRFLFHLVEKHVAAVVDNRERALSTLLSIVQPSGDVAGSAGQSTSIGRFVRKLEQGLKISPKSSQKQDNSVILPSTICGTHLLSEEDLEDFRSLGQWFEPLENDSSLALECFLLRLSQEFSQADSAIDVFDKIRSENDLRNVFIVPAPPG